MAATTAIDLAPWTQKYGIVYGARIAPTENVFPVSNLSTQRLAEWRRQKVNEDFQRRRFRGFSMRELMDHDAISSRHLKTGNLQNRVLPMLRKARWERLIYIQDSYITRKRLYPLSSNSQNDGLTGDWIASNPLVWTQLEPALKIASRLLHSIHILDWFSALLMSGKRPVAPDRIPEHWKSSANTVARNELLTFRLNNSFAAEDVAAVRDDVFEDLYENYNLSFGFRHPSRDFFTDKLDRDEENTAASTSLEGDKQIWMSLNLKIVAPLLRSDLNDSERLGHQWFIANTIVHEIMHAIAYLKSAEWSPTKEWEPYFEDEAIGELGFSMEHAVFSGYSVPFVDHASPSPPFNTPHLGHWIISGWPSIQDAELSNRNQPILKFPKLNDKQWSFPIPVSTYEDVQQEDFWEVGIRQYGFQLLHVARQAQRGGRLISHAGGFDDRGYPLHVTSDNTTVIPYVAPGFYRFRETVESFKNIMNMTPDYRAAHDFGVRMLQSAQLRDQFWIQVDIITDAITGILNSISNPDNINTIEHQRQMLEEQFNFLQCAREAHQTMIIRMLEAEEINAAIYTERRRDLINWNRGTRIFVKEFIQGLQSHGNLGDTTAAQEILHREAICLELCRMMLCSPDGSGTTDQVELNEIAALQKAHTEFNSADFAGCIATCSQLVQVDASSPFADACAHLLAGKVTSRPDADRVSAIERANKIFSDLILEAANKSRRIRAPPAWRLTPKWTSTLLTLAREADTLHTAIVLARGMQS